MHAKWNNMLPTLFKKRAGYTQIQQARPVLAYIKVHNAPILCSFVWRIRHADWQVAELLTTACQISETTGWYIVYILRRIMRSGNKPEFPFYDSCLSQYTLSLQHKKKHGVLDRTQRALQSSVVQILCCYAIFR